jgi:hypothetical protein
LARAIALLFNQPVRAGWGTMSYPSVGSALLAGTPWLHVVCPACGIVGEADLRSIDIHPNASVAAVVRRISCVRCCPHSPLAKPTGLTRRSWHGNGPWLIRRRLAIEIQPDGPSWAQKRRR